MKVKKFLMIATCSIMVLLTSCGIQENTMSGTDYLSGGTMENENTSLSTMSASDVEMYLSMDDVTKIAQKDAGITEGEIENLHVRLNDSDEKKEYIVTFTTVEKTYKYCIAASDGIILEKSIDIINLGSDTQFSVEGESEILEETSISNPTQVTSTQDKEITQDKAVEIARKDAGVSESEMFDLKVKLDYEHGIQVYEIDFDTANMEYEYEIAVSDGSIVNKKTEQQDHILSTPKSTQTASNQTKEITQDEAVEIARKDAGISESEMFNLKVKLDFDDGIRLYEIEFYCNGYEYEYEIGASDGKILKKEWDN